ncbi:MAG TPA: ATP-binding cassette domain-containing protein [Gemmatimonadales bacterium]|nr:ATP-binding cassette domain-containing protein [Gemmatimonadales bacterium]
MTSPSAEVLVEVRGLSTHFALGNRWLGERLVVKAVDDVDLDLRRGEILGLVGESGSGKTTLGRSILRLVEPTAGSVRFGEADILRLPREALRALRRRMQIVFQDPYRSLSPRMQIRSLIAEPLRLHRIVAEAEVEDAVAELLGRVGLEPYFMWRYPHEMSGGQRQRIAIARALAVRPGFLVADEPVSALDVSVQAQILGLLLELQRAEGFTMLLITHDLAVVERVADRVAVMQAGRLVETGETAALLRNPGHPYTRRLLQAASRRVPREAQGG